MKQLRLGTKIESEHKGTVRYLKNYMKQYKTLPPNQKIFKSIAKDHIKEDPNYYYKLRRLKL